MLNSGMTVLKSFKNGQIMEVDGENVLIVSATGPIIPMNEFKLIFNFVGKIAREKEVEKLIFDKRKLEVFNQPSMEWYFTIWKEEMYHMGLLTHRKILPNDEIFRESVKIGREQIYEDYPNGKFHLMDIAYCKDIEEAILN